MNDNTADSADGLFRLLFLGDVVGEPGRKAVSALLPLLKEELKTDFIVVNGENSAGGRGITPKIAISLMRAGATVVTSGDHIWDQKEIVPYLSDEPRMLRPLNYPAGTPGSGCIVLESKKCKVAVVNLQGRTFMNQQLDNPFRVITECIESLRQETPVIFVDFHAEATSEKVAMGWHLDGKVSAVIGTHTHVPTADERVLPKGTAFQSDAGMCGPMDSVIGADRAGPILRFTTEMHSRFSVKDGPAELNGVIVHIEEGKAVHVERYHHEESE